jgi:AcrR family transcriptional regulator
MKQSSRNANLHVESSTQPIRRVGPSRKLKRREQQRAINTRLVILKAALSEFAEQGFDAASIRNIAVRTGLQHPLITYHFRTKEILWRAVAEHVFTEIQTLWDDQGPIDSQLSALERVREEYRAFLRFQLEYPDFHHFMLRESRPRNPRLAWLTKRFLKPLLMSRLLPQISAAQKAGELPNADPILIHYMLIGMISVLSSVGDEIRLVANISPTDPEVVDAYWELIDHAVFGRKQPVRKK